jgi:crotonobetainyl-CoA:carnitine CoA-transferase CaiB-like acyl-CoA transferase
VTPGAWRVLELPGPDALARCGRYLAALGAEVVAVRPGGPGPHDRGKRALPPGPWVDAARRAADVVLGGDGRVGVSIAAPPGGPADLELAAGTWDPPVGRLRGHPLAVAGTVAGAYAAIGAAAAAWAVERGQPGRAVAVDALAAGLSAHELTALLRMDPPTRWSPLRWAGSPFVAAYPAADGAGVFVHLGLPRHLARFLEWAAAQGLPEAGPLARGLSEATRLDPLAVGSVVEGLAARRRLRALFRRRTAAEWEEGMSAAGLCAARCRTAAEWLAHEQPLADGQVVEASGRRVPGPPVHVRGLPDAPASDPASWTSDGRVPDRPLAPPLAGIRVLDLTRVIAGPVAGRTLAALGATVDKIVDPRETQGWVEAFRSVFDAGKAIVPLDLSAPAGRAALRERLRGERPDVVLHNLRPEAAARLGVDDASLRTLVPDAVPVVVSAYGATGPWAGRPGWEQTAQAVSGTQLEYGGGRPELVPLPATDLATGLFAALGAVVALRARGAGAPSPRVDVSLTGAQVQLRDAAPTPPAGAIAAGLPARLAAVPGLVVRAERPGIGAITELALPWRVDGVARTLPGPGAVPGAPGPRSRLRAAASTARWAALVAAGRVGRWPRGGGRGGGGG